MAQKVPEEIANELWKAINKLEIANDKVRELKKINRNQVLSSSNLKSV